MATATEATVVNSAPDAANADVHKPVKVVKKVKTVKEKKEKKPKAPAAHPTYHEMIVEAISALKERTGSSQHAIAKYMDIKYKTVLPENYKKILAVQLRNLSKKGKLAKVKASYKLSEAAKKPSTAAKKGSESAAKDVQKVKSVKAKAPKVPKSPKAPKMHKSPKAPKPTATPKVAKSAKIAIPAKASAIAIPAKKDATPKKAKVGTPKAVKLAKSPAKTPKPASAIKPAKSPVRSVSKKVVPAAKRAKKVGK